MKFEASVKVILDLEGGSKVTDNPKDPGGLTKYGISLRAFPELGRTGIRNLTRAKAIDIYQKNYWTPSKAEAMPEPLRLLVFDSAVNQGVTASAVILQRTLNTMLKKKLVLDGVVGPLTLAAVAKIDPVELCACYLYERASAYRQSGNYDEFGEGWEKRLFRVSLLNDW